MKTKLIFVRHGRTPENTRGVMHVNQDETPLDDVGKNQIERTAAKLKSTGIDKIYSSTERRAEESAQIISDVCGVPYETSGALIERDWGEFAGEAWEKVEEILKTMSLEERYNYTPEGGESWKSTEDRLKTFVSGLLDTHVGETVVVVTHAGAIRILMPFLLDAPIEKTFKHLPDNASLTIFDYENGVFEQVVANDTSHLE